MATPFSALRAARLLVGIAGAAVLSVGLASPANAPAPFISSAAAALMASHEPATFDEGPPVHHLFRPAMIVPPVVLSTPPPAPITTTTSAPTPRIAPHPSPPSVPAPPAPPAPPVYRNWLAGAGVSTSLGVYADCTGATPLTHAQAQIDVCFTDRLYILGHNPGVFTPLMSVGIGAIVTWYDNNASARPLRVVGIENHAWDSGNPPLMNGATVQLQLCANASGSIDRIVNLAPA